MANISASESPANRSDDSALDRYHHPTPDYSEICPQILPVPPENFGEPCYALIDNNPTPRSHRMETEGIVPSDVVGAGAGGATSEPESDSLGKLNGRGMPSAFILDSRVPFHATGNDGVLSSTRALEAGDASSLTRRDGKILMILAVGLIRLMCYSLDDVHYVPDLGPTSTLVSVHQLTQRGFSVMFCGASCYVKDRSTGAIVGKGQLRDEDGFYHLDYLRIPIS